MTLSTPPKDAPARGRQALQRSIAWYLRQLSRVLNVLSDEELERLIPMLTERQFKPRQVLFQAGDPPERVYLLLKGRVKIYQVAENGKEIILDVVGKGGVVGDMAIVEDGERTACAQAIDDTVAVSISWEDFSHVLQRSPKLGFVMMELMARRLAGMQRTFMNIVSKPVSARLADVLLNRQERGMIHLGLTHQELAQTIGTSRETVTALLSRFVTLGAITPMADGYLILDEDLLDDIANGDVPVSPRHPVSPQASSMAT
ncbi:MAG TPA: Crp/Fnr family transcriptional regulator [Tepidiformaceae bacterium]|nr:Crp/Fnr family transcriptional regulator [Tepidiformaceae bacterium]HNO65985.1 Crp/Fnr family transcriptional regulator [Tepidiformaceae bacterium]